MRVVKQFASWLAVLTIGVVGLVVPAPVVAQQALSQATYTVLFQSTWSNETHPHPHDNDNFPSNAHFSSLIGATHTISSSLWMPDAVASAGIEQMAETGGTTQLRAEISALGNDALETVSGPGLGTSSGMVTIPQITVDTDHPAVTLVTMIAPSPDWFVGVHGLSLLDDSGAWQDEVVITLYPYDAGTDDGTDYTSPNAEPETHQPISELTGTDPFSSEPIGTLTFTRQQQHRLFLPYVQNGLLERE